MNNKNNMSKMRAKKPKKRKAKRSATPKGINWSKALAKALEQEDDRDAHRVVELIRELYYIVIVKHGQSSKSK